MSDQHEAMIVSIGQQHFELMKRCNADRRAHFVAELTCMSFLIDRGLATHEQVAERLQAVQRSLPADYRDAPVTERLDFLRQVLESAYGQPNRGWTPVVIEGGLSGRQPDDAPDQR